MKRGQVFVRARRTDGGWGSVDALDLDDESFRAFVLDGFVRRGLVIAIRDEHVEGEAIELRERPRDGVRHKLVDNTLLRDDRGIIARCTCGWVSAGHFSSMAASAAFREHQESAGST